MLLSDRRDLAAARRFFASALRAGTIPAEVTTDRAPAYPRILEELIPSARHTVEQYANNPVETDHGRLKARLRPMRGLKRHRSAQIVSTGHAFVQNIPRGHYELAIDVPGRHRLRHAFDQLTLAICQQVLQRRHALAIRPASQRNTAGHAPRRQVLRTRALTMLATDCFTALHTYPRRLHCLFVIEVAAHDSGIDTDAASRPRTRPIFITTNRQAHGPRSSLSHSLRRFARLRDSPNRGDLVRRIMF